MATQTKQAPGSTHRDTDYGVGRFQEVNERLVDTSRKATGVYLETYEKTVKTVADFEERLAGASQNEWLASMVRAHAELSREVVKVQTSAARELLK